MNEGEFGAPPRKPKSEKAPEMSQEGGGVIKKVMEALEIDPESITLTPDEHEALRQITDETKRGPIDTDGIAEILRKARDRS